MGIIDIDNMFKEMRNTMESNFYGTAEERFKQAKELFLESVEVYIDENKKELIKEVKKSIN